MEIQQNIASIMRALKERRGKSLDEFSNELEISRSMLQEYLSGRGNPSMSTINHLSEKLGVDAIVLLSGSYSNEQVKILLKLLDTFELLFNMTPEKRHRFAELLLEMISLWE